MRKNTCYVLLMLLSILFVQCVSGEKQLNRKLINLAEGINESVPVMLDINTRFDGSSVSDDNVFRYKYTVLNTSNPDSLLEASVEILRKRITDELATNPDLQIFRENDVTVEYVYMDNQNRNICSLQFTPDDYR